MTALRFLLHPEGYASYRIRVDWNAGRPRHTCVVTDYAAATPQAHRALWQVLLGTDLVATIETAQLPLEDPLAHLLTDARQVTTQSQRDGLWLRPIDVAGLLAARRYGIEVDAVIEVTDPLFGDRRVRLEGGPDGAECTPTDALPDLVLSADQLGSIYLGGYRLRTIAAAGLVVAEDSVLTRLDRAFLAEREPFHGTNF
jgi:predicted acetyltransferase